jgi:YHS domain-containing protein
MIHLRKFGWSALVLAALVGCDKAPEPAPTTPATDATSTTAPPDATAAPEADKGTGAAPAVDMPKVESPAAAPAEPPAEEKKAETKGAAAAASLSDEEVAEIKKLPAGEAEHALAQMVCPVSDEKLGSMGMPLKVTAEGRTFYLCCKGCNQEVKDNPSAVVAKLKK